LDGFVESSPRFEELRRETMRTPDEVAAMLRLKALGWGVRRIAAEFGCSHGTVRRYLKADGWVEYQAPRRAKIVPRGVV
jgi:DNA-directed RNA polymerase specialized sigma24 family protein